MGAQKPLQFMIKLIKYILFSSIVLIMQNTFAQSDTINIDVLNLKNKLENTTEKGVKANLLKEIIVKSFPNSPDDVFYYSSDLLTLGEQLNNNELVAFAKFYLGEYYYTEDEFENALKNYTESLEQYKLLHDQNQIAQLYLNLGLTNQYLNNYEQALEYYQKAIDVFTELENKEQVAICYQDIGTLYNDLTKYSLALIYYEKALDIFKELGNKSRSAASLQNIGVLHYNWKNFDQALEFYKKSLKIYEELKNLNGIGTSLSNIGLVYEENKQYEKSLEFYQKALLVFEELDYKPAIVYVYYNLGSINRNLKNLKKSIEYFEKGLALSQKHSLRDYTSYNYEALSSIYEMQGNHSKALLLYKQYIQLKDSIINEEKYRQIEEIEAKYQNSKHIREIENLKLDQQLKESELQQKDSQNIILLFSFIFIIIISVILFIFYRSQRKLIDKLNIETNQHKITSEKLKEAKDDLEIRVNERTLDLKKMNQHLLQEIEEHKITLENLRIAKNKAEESDRLKSNFLANMSHEIRTPMNAITGFSQMLEYENLPKEKRKEYIRLIGEGCSNLTILIDDIIDFAKIESGEVKIEKKEFNPHPMLEYLYDYYTNEIIKRGKENLHLTYANENKDNDITIYTDQEKLKQILSTLLDNAIKFTEKGRIEFGFILSLKNQIEFYVRDTGIGIEEKKQSIIFERFRQVDEGTTRKYGGAGIGLSISKSLVEMLDGKIWVESTLGKGATFYVNMPHKSKGKTLEFIQPEQFKWKGKLILVAEDKKINFEIIKESVNGTQAEVIWAKNGKEAIDLVQENPKIDLILMDIQMPVMDGLEATRKIKQIRATLPVIAQTAYALPQDSFKCIDAGCDDYIAKPIPLDEFLKKINKYIG
jgi:signal transduction histidine kinase/CheY-like chemotaxis protein